ncbi:dicarboxylate transporter/tellurite-resistance protein TehA [Nocardioides sp. AN3]
MSVPRPIRQPVSLGRARERLPLSTLAIPLGLAGLAQVWSVGMTAVGAPDGFAQVFWVIAGISWLVTAAAHVHRGTRTDHRLSDQLRHVGHGPLAALLPITAMLLGVGLHRTYAGAGTVLAVCSIVVAAVFGAWMLTFWMEGEISLEDVHGGYYCPISASGLVGALAAGQSGLRLLALGCFTVGVLFYIVISVFLLLRLALRPRLPAPLVPTLAIMMAPPAFAAGAWLTISGGRPDPLFDSLTGLAVFMALVQLALLPQYLALPFTVGFWSFTFPLESVALLAMIWLGIERPFAWQEATVALVGALTLVIGVIAARSLLELSRSVAQPGVTEGRFVHGPPGHR